jgi:predicted small metal-binding protein
MIGPILKLTCACGWVTSGREEEVVAAAQQHGRMLHNMETSREEVLALAEVLPDAR